MQIQYTKQNEKTTEVNISAKQDQWLLFVKVIEETGCLPTFAGDDASPYDGTCVSLIVQIATSEKIMFSVCGDILEIKGSAKCFNQLSNSIIAFAEEFAPGEHFHLDWIDSEYISSDSAFVVLNMK